jgi:hypothetical protein
MADALESWDDEVDDRISWMCDSCVTSTETDGASVALVSSRGDRAVVHATDDSSAALETLQIDLAEGPCVDVQEGYGPILIDDLLSPQEGLGNRWPFFMPEAKKLGVRAVFTFPLRVGSVVLGSLELHRDKPGPLNHDQLDEALEAAQDMGNVMIDRAVDSTRLGRSATITHQAAGMVMVQINGTIKEGMARLRATAFAEDVGLVTLSTDVVEGRRRFSSEEQT